VDAEGAFGNHLRDIRGTSFTEYLAGGVVRSKSRGAEVAEYLIRRDEKARFRVATRHSSGSGSPCASEELAKLGQHRLLTRVPSHDREGVNRLQNYARGRKRRRASAAPSIHAGNPHVAPLSIRTKTIRRREPPGASAPAGSVGI